MMKSSLVCLMILGSSLWVSGASPQGPNSRIEIYPRILAQEKDLRKIALSDEALAQLIKKGFALFDWSMVLPYEKRESIYSKQTYIQAGQTLAEAFKKVEKRFKYEMRDEFRVKIIKAGRVTLMRYDAIPDDLKNEVLRPGDIILVSRGSEW